MIITGAAAWAKRLRIFTSHNQHSRATLTNDSALQHRSEKTPPPCPHVIQDSWSSLISRMDCINSIPFWCSGQSCPQFRCSNCSMPAPWLRWALPVATWSEQNPLVFEGLSRFQDLKLWKTIGFWEIPRTPGVKILKFHWFLRGSEGFRCWNLKKPLKKNWFIRDTNDNRRQNI